MSVTSMIGAIVTTRSSRATLPRARATPWRFLGDTLAAEKIDHAATGLAAAWQMNHFASFRIATFLLRSEPTVTGPSSRRRPHRCAEP